MSDQVFGLNFDFPPGRLSFPEDFGDSGDSPVFADAEVGDFSDDFSGEYSGGYSDVILKGIRYTF